MKILTASLFAFLVLLTNRAEAGTLFRCPLSSCSSVTSWFDHNTTVGAKLRYDGSTNFNYDNHRGLDYSRTMGTTIYVAAHGDGYYYKSDCPDDGSYPACGSQYGNHIRVLHLSDNLVSIYAHMKKNTPVYASFLCGAKGGEVGNSGKSSNPHLHFELWKDKAASQRLDFYGGAPNSNKSYWTTYNSPNTTCQ